MEQTARIKERQSKDVKKYQSNKMTYCMETPTRRYVPFFHHVYYYTKYIKKVKVDTGRPNKNKADIHIIYSLLICKWLFNYWDDEAIKNKDKKDGVKNSDLILIRGLAFDKELVFYKHGVKIYGGKMFEGNNPPTAYNNFFNEELGTEEERKRYLNNNKFDDYYKQVNYEDFCNIVGGLMQVYETYALDIDGFRTSMKENRIFEDEFSRRYIFAVTNICNIINDVVGKSPNGKEVLYKLNKYHLYEGWMMCCNRFKKKLEKTFPYNKTTKKKKFTWKMIRSKKRKQPIRINKSSS